MTIRSPLLTVAIAGALACTSAAAGDRAVPPVKGGVVLVVPAGQPDPRADELAGLLADEMARFTERLTLIVRAVPDAERQVEAARSCQEQARAAIWVDYRQTEARLAVRVCATNEVLERWAPFLPEDPDRSVTLAHLTAALLRAGLSSGPPDLGHNEHIEPPPPVAEPAEGQQPGEDGQPARRRREPDREKPDPAEQGIERPAAPTGPVADSSVEFDARLSVGNLASGSVLVGGGVGAALPVIDQLAIRLDLTVYSAATKEKGGYFAELYSVPLMLSLCYRPVINRFRIRACAEASLNMASIRSGPLESGQGARRYDLKLNPGLGGGAGARVYILPYVFGELYLSARYYLKAQRYTVEGQTLISIPRHDLEARAGVGITF